MKWEYAIGVIGFALLAIGHGLGLFWAPPEAMMGDVGRILYVHVPTAWVALLTYLAAFVCAVGALATGRRRWDAAMEAAVEVGVLLNSMLLIQGSIWARPTWGVWWTWDPRLTTAAVMVLAFAVVLVLRRLIDSPERRLTASGVATIIAFVDVPIVYFSVKWWRSLHQPFSDQQTVDSRMLLPLEIAALGMLFLSISLVVARARIALAHLAAEDDAPELPPLPPPVNLAGGR